jgi:IclR family transcriptional regulator, KDG regulon repressor
MTTQYLAVSKFSGGARMLSSVRNIARILKSFRLDKPEMTLSELSRKLGIPKSTMFKLLHTMMSEGFLEKNEGTGKYRPGRHMSGLGRTILAGSEWPNIAYPYLKSLARQTGLTAHLSCYEQGEVIWLVKVEDYDSFPLYSRVGRRAPAYAPASGKAILAFLGEAEISQLVLHHWKTLTPKTNTDKTKFLSELDRTKQSGFSIQREEVELGAASLAVPVLDTGRKPVAGISVAGQKSRFQGNSLTEIRIALRQTALDIASCM